MAEKRKKAVIGSLQPNVDEMLDWNTLTCDDFAPASNAEKEDFIQQRKSVSYWSDASRLGKNLVAMVALGIIVLLVLFAFVGPMLVPYDYDQRIAGAENLFPHHYTLGRAGAVPSGHQHAGPGRGGGAGPRRGGGQGRGAQPPG